VLSAVPPADLGRASAVNNISQRFGTAFGIAAATAVFLAKGSLGTTEAFTAGMRPALFTPAGLAILGVMSALAVRKSQASDAGLRETALAGATGGS
jgi:hypothetical protein